MRESKLLIVAVILLATLVCLTAPAAAGRYAHERQGLVLGLNLGLGGAKVEWDEPNLHFETDTETGAAAGIRIGYAFNPQFVLAFEGTAWGRDYDDGQITLTTALVNFTWYPQGQGFFLRAGVGTGRAEVTVDVFDPDLSWEENGPAFRLGLGHEWRLTPRFALGAALDYSDMTFDSFGGLQDVQARFTNVTVQLNWYL